MINNLQNKELEEALALLQSYKEMDLSLPIGILEDINEEVHSPAFLKLICEENEHDI